VFPEDGGSVRVGRDRNASGSLNLRQGFHLAEQFRLEVLPEIRFRIHAGPFRYLVNKHQGDVALHAVHAGNVLFELGPDLLAGQLGADGFLTVELLDSVVHPSRILLHQSVPGGLLCARQRGIGNLVNSRELRRYGPQGVLLHAVLVEGELVDDDFAVNHPVFRVPVGFSGGLVAELERTGHGPVVELFLGRLLGVEEAVGGGVVLFRAFLGSDLDVSFLDLLRFPYLVKIVCLRFV